ncbi:MAG: hypothetical protein A4E45_00169 [Methanosaeta sp. PtaB.Bin039]|nr:MAG: hypothetical protein A4E45_00169 [Methanosaeta sp. PtaB.Bin039]OPY45207.1 MAG: hypothetical protein A4E47_01061 [Methanosaeta sp. PtaU1.Bin028]HQF16625.1 hypothetical protein [Methanotrichaceae archaeon]HQI91257.1 hypothetical protein [Methanotrichaceae archaeon]HQJ61696.1 hypothetical protein [Methanothrix soehngenii]
MDPEDKETLLAILKEIKALREEVQRVAIRLEILEILLLPDEDEVDEDSLADGDKVIEWARLRKNLGM